MDALSEEPLIKSVTAYIEEYMSNYDASHSYDHIQRVVALARRIYAESPAEPALDPKVILLGALLHDVGDRKYLKPCEDATTMVAKILVEHGAPEDLAEKVQAICLGVSYSTESKNPERVRELIKVHPELAVVQDADRIDAIGAVGLGRMFTYGGAKTGRSLADSMEHVDEKLLRLEGMTKTEAGRKIAKERTERLLLFKQWWKEETSEA